MYGPRDVSGAGAMPSSPKREPGHALRRARDAQSGLFLTVGLFSIVVNLLMLTGPLFMLQIYDRVLSSRSEATLVALIGLVAFLYLMFGILDHLRGRVAARAGAQFQSELDGTVFTAAMAWLRRKPDDPNAHRAQQDMDAVSRLMSSPVFLALFDLPWTPLFILLIYVFHPMLGALALLGALLLVAITWANQRMTRRAMAEAQSAVLDTQRYGDQLQREAELLRGLGMQGTARDQWIARRQEALDRSLALSDRGGVFSSLSRSFRLFLQSAMLALGAWYVLRGALTPGAMIAASIILGRALAPLEQVVAQWEQVQRAREGWRNLAVLLADASGDTRPTALPRPRAVLQLQRVMLAPPGASQMALKGVSFRLEPGQALGVIGPSGAGKSALARAVVGAWPVLSGKITLDGAPIDQYAPDVLGRLIGYLPQHVTLLDGTIAQNIARLDSNADADRIVEAARRAGAHDMILALPDGYDTRIRSEAPCLSGGQLQRVALARALYGTPVVAVLDEPNANLDNEGSMAMNAAVRGLKSIGSAVMVMAHRPAAIQECDLLLMLEDGQVAAFGPRDEVLRKVARNHTELLRAAPLSPSAGSAS